MKLKNSIGSKLMIMILFGMLIPTTILFISFLFSIKHISQSSQSLISDQVLTEVKSGIKNTVQSVISNVENKYKGKTEGLSEEEIIQLIKNEFDAVKYSESGYF